MIRFPALIVRMFVMLAHRISYYNSALVLTTIHFYLTCFRWRVHQQESKQKNVLLQKDKV